MNGNIVLTVLPTVPFISVLHTIGWMLHVEFLVTGGGERKEEGVGGRGEGARGGHEEGGGGGETAHQRAHQRCAGPFIRSTCHFFSLLFISFCQPHLLSSPPCFCFSPLPFMDQINHWVTWWALSSPLLTSAQAFFSREELSIFPSSTRVELCIHTRHEPSWVLINLVKSIGDD